MHRSGTSLVASIMSALSIDMGQDLLPADSNNVRGYFEDVEFLELQRAILSASCSSDDGGHPDWGWTEGQTLDNASFERFVPEAFDGADGPPVLVVARPTDVWGGVEESTAPTLLEAREAL